MPGNKNRQHSRSSELEVKKVVKEKAEEKAKVKPKK